MNGLEGAAVWVGSGLSLALAIAVPWVTLRWLNRPETLPEMWLLSRRGVVPAVCLAGAVVLILVGIVTGLGALAHPFLWSTVVLIAGTAVAVLIVLPLRPFRPIRAPVTRLGLPGRRRTMTNLLRPVAVQIVDRILPYQRVAFALSL